MSFNIDPNVKTGQTDSAKNHSPASRKTPSVDDVNDFEKTLLSRSASPFQNGIWNWEQMDGYKPEYKEYTDQTSIVVTDDSIDVTVPEAPKDEEKKGGFAEFLEWAGNAIGLIAELASKAVQINMLSSFVSNLTSASQDFFGKMGGDSNPVQGAISKIDSQRLHKLNQAASEGPENLANAVKTMVSEDPASAAEIAAAALQQALQVNSDSQSVPSIAAAITKAATEAAPSAAPQIAGEVTKAAVAANPEAAPKIAGEVTRAAVAANPQAAPQIAGEVTNAAVAANPQAAPQIAGEVTKAAVTANPQAAPQIAGEVTRAAVAANPEAAPQIAGEVTNAAATANPQAAPKIGEEVTKSATQAAPEATQQVKSEVTKAMAQTSGKSDSSKEPVVTGGPKKVEGQTGNDEPASVTNSKVQIAAEAASSAANVGGNVSPATVNMESTTQSAAPSGLDKRLNNILADIVKTVKELNIGDTFTTISFNDSTLRDVTVEISLNNGRLEVAFSTSNPDSQNLLQSNISALQNALQAGSGVSSVNVSVAGEPEEFPEFPEGGGEGTLSKSTDTKSDKKVSGRGSASSS